MRIHFRNSSTWARFSLRFSFFVRVCAVETGFELPRFVQLLKPQARSETLRARGMIRGEVDHLLKTLTRPFVIEVVECFVAFRAKRIELLALVLRRNSAQTTEG